MNLNGIQKERKRSDKSIRVMREQRHNFNPSIFFAEFLIVAMVLASSEGDLPDADQVVGVT